MLAQYISVLCYDMLVNGKLKPKCIDVIIMYVSIKGTFQNVHGKSINMLSSAEY